MIVRLLLLAVAVAAPAVAETIIPDPDWVGPPAPTEYDLVEEADGILVVRAVAGRRGQVRFKIEESVKGSAGKKGAWLDARAETEEGSRYLVFLDRSEEEWGPSGLGFLEIESQDQDWVRVLRLFARVSALDDDEEEKSALRRLREAAVAHPGRYPAALLIRMIDLHFGTPTPDKSFSDLMDLWDAAATDAERLAVLWALRYGEHPETGAFFRSLLAGGEPLWLMRPVLEWMEESGELPLLKDLARVWLAHPWEDRNELLDLMLAIAEPGDAPLLWSLAPWADLGEKQKLAEHVLGGSGPDPVADKLDLPPDERSRADLLTLRIGALGWTESRLDAILRQEQAAPGAKPAGSMEELLAAFEAAQEPAERRGILMEVFRRTQDDGRKEDLPVLWRLLRQASPREAEALLEWAFYLPADQEELVGFYRAVSGEEEKNRALWLILAVWGHDVEPLLSAAGALGEGSVRLERVARAFLTCPSAELRLDLAAQLAELATPGDYLTLLKVLAGASLAEARVLAPWFASHPGPEALSILWRLPIPSLYKDPELAEALAAAGDPEVLDLALELRRRLTTEDDPWAYAVLARSPLSAAQEEAREILERGGHARLQLLWEVAEEDNASPWREWYLREIADSGSVDEAIRERALTSLAKLSEDEPQP